MPVIDLLTIAATLIVLDWLILGIGNLCQFARSLGQAAKGFQEIEQEQADLLYLSPLSKSDDQPN